MKEAFHWRQKIAKKINDVFDWERKNYSGNRWFFVWNIPRSLRPAFSAISVQWWETLGEWSANGEFLPSSVDVELWKSTQVLPSVCLLSFFPCSASVFSFPFLYYSFFFSGCSSVHWNCGVVFFFLGRNEIKVVSAKEKKSSATSFLLPQPCGISVWGHLHKMRKCIKCQKYASFAKSSYSWGSTSWPAFPTDLLVINTLCSHVTQVAEVLVLWPGKCVYSVDNSTVIVSDNRDADHLGNNFFCFCGGDEQSEECKCRDGIKERTQ